MSWRIETADALGRNSAFTLRTSSLEHGLLIADRRARRLRPQRRLRGHASSVSTGWSTAAGGSDACRGDALSADPQSDPLRAQRVSEVVSASGRHDSQLRRQRAGAPRVCVQAAEAGGDWSAAFPAAPRRAHPGGMLSGVSDARAARCRAGGRLVDVMSYCFRHEPSEDRRTDADVPDARARPRGRRRHGRSAWREEWLRRAGAFIARRSGSTRAQDVAVRSVLRPRRPAARRRISASSGSRSRSLVPIASDERPTAIDLAQLPPGSLRQPVRHHDCRRQRSRTRRASGSASSGLRWRSTAARPRTRAVAVTPVREALRLCDAAELWRARPGDVRAAIPLHHRGPRLARVELLRRSLDRAAARRAASSRWRRCRSPSPSTSRATSGRSSSSRSPTSTALYGVEVFELNVWRSARRPHRGAARPGAAGHRGSRRVSSARHRWARAIRPSTSRRRSASQAIDACARRARLLPQCRLLRARGRPTSPACSVSTDDLTGPSICRPMWRSPSSRSRPALTGRRPGGRVARAASAPILRGGRRATRFAATPRASQPISNGWPVNRSSSFTGTPSPHCGSAARRSSSRGAYLRWLRANGEHGLDPSAARPAT